MYKRQVTFDQVLAVNNGEMKIGCPTVEGATVSATVVKEGKGKKVIVYKYKRETGYHKKNGHRQLFRDVYKRQGYDPRTMEKVYVPTNPHEKAMQRALIQYLSLIHIW